MPRPTHAHWRMPATAPTYAPPSMSADSSVPLRAASSPSHSLSSTWRDDRFLLDDLTASLAPSEFISTLSGSSHQARSTSSLGSASTLSTKASTTTSSGLSSEPPLAASPVCSAPTALPLRVSFSPSSTLPIAKHHSPDVSSTASHSESAPVISAAPRTHIPVTAAPRRSLPAAASDPSPRAPVTSGDAEAEPINASLPSDPSSLLTGSTFLSLEVTRRPNAPPAQPRPATQNWQVQDEEDEDEDGELAEEAADADQLSPSRHRPPQEQRHSAVLSPSDAAPVASRFPPHSLEVALTSRDFESKYNHPEHDSALSPLATSGSSSHASASTDSSKPRATTVRFISPVSAASAPSIQATTPTRSQDHTFEHVSQGTPTLTPRISLQPSSATRSPNGSDGSSSSSPSSRSSYSTPSPRPSPSPRSNPSPSSSRSSLSESSSSSSPSSSASSPSSRSESDSVARDLTHEFSSHQVSAIGGTRNRHGASASSLSEYSATHDGDVSVSLSDPSSLLSPGIRSSHPITPLSAARVHQTARRWRGVDDADLFRTSSAYHAGVPAGVAAPRVDAQPSVGARSAFPVAAAAARRFVPAPVPVLDAPRATLRRAAAMLRVASRAHSER